MPGIAIKYWLFQQDEWGSVTELPPEPEIEEQSRGGGDAEHIVYIPPTPQELARQLRKRQPVSRLVRDTRTKVVLSSQNRTTIELIDQFSVQIPFFSYIKQKELAVTSEQVLVDLSVSQSTTVNIESYVHLKGKFELYPESFGYLAVEELSITNKSITETPSPSRYRNVIREKQEFLYEKRAFFENFSFSLSSSQSIEGNLKNICEKFTFSARNTSKNERKWQEIEDLDLKMILNSGILNDLVKNQDENDEIEIEIELDD